MIKEYNKACVVYVFFIYLEQFIQKGGQLKQL